MKELNLYEKENLSNVEKKIDVGFVIEDESNNLKKKDFVTANQIKMFLKRVQGFLCTMVNKLFERSPLASVFLLSAAMRDSNIVLSNASKQKLNPCLRPLSKYQLELNIPSPKQCDIAAGDCKTLMNSEVNNMKRESVKFSQKEDRLDGFHFKVAGVSKYKDL